MPKTTIPCQLCEDKAKASTPHEHASVKYPNGTTLVFHGADNKFTCLCGHKYAISSLRTRHVHQCRDCMEAAGITLFDMSKSLDPKSLSSKEFIRIPELDKIMFQIHKATGMLVCTKCRVGVWPDKIRYHCGESFSHTAGYTETKIDQEKVNANKVERYLRSQLLQPCMQKKQIEQWVETLQKRVNPSIPGIGVAKDAYLCKSCGFPTVYLRTMRAHQNIHHRTVAKDFKSSYKHGKAQILYKNAIGDIMIGVATRAPRKPAVRKQIPVQRPPAVDLAIVPIEVGNPWTTEIGFKTIRDEDSFSDMARLSQWSIPTEMWERALYFISGAALDSLKHKEHTKSIAKGVNTILVDCCYQLVYTLIRTSEKYGRVEYFMLTPAQYDLAKKLRDYLMENAMDIMYSKSYKQEAVKMMWLLHREMWMVQRNFGDGYAHFFSIFRYFCYASWNVKLRCFCDTFSILALAEGLSFWARAAILVAFEQESAAANYPFMSVTSVVGNGVVYENKAHHLSIYEGFLEKDGCTPFSVIHKVTQLIGKPKVPISTESDK